MLLHFVRWLRENSELEPSFLIVRDGPLTPAFEDIAPVTVLDSTSSRVPGVGLVRQIGVAGLTLSGSRPGMTRFESKLRAGAGSALISKARREMESAEPDLIYLNSVASASLVSIAKPSIPIIAHVHERTYGLRIIRALDPAGVARLIARADYYVAAARTAADALTTEYGIDRTRVHVSHGFIPIADGPLGVSPGADVRHELGLPADALIVGALGSIEWHKGADLFIQLARHVLAGNQHERPVHFVWVGGTNDPFWPERIRYDLEMLGIAEQVRFVGAVDDPSQLLQAMDVFVLTSRDDTFPLVCLEASALGKPIVCFDAGGMTEFLEPSERLVVPYLDVDAMASRVTELLSSGDDRRRLGRTLAQRVWERHRLEVGAPALLEHIERAYRLPPVR
jgi:glycosyltransferase involved in cell wall biosynthesis